MIQVSAIWQLIVVIVGTMSLVIPLFSTVHRLALVGVEHGLEFLLGRLQRGGSRVKLDATCQTDAQSVAGCFWNYPQTTLWHDCSLAHLTGGQ